MKVMHIVNVADAQSIPLELALAIKDRLPDTVVAGFYARGDHPLEAAGDRIVSLGARSAADRAAIGRLRALIREEKPDIIHLHHAVSAFWVALIVLFSWTRPRLVKTEHNDHRFLPWHQTAINLLLYPFLARIVCNSDTTKASFRRMERWFAGRRSMRIYNGVNLAEVRRLSWPATAAPPPPVVIGNTGRAVPQKNQHRLIEGLAAARTASGRDIRLEILGNGPLLEDLQRHARDHGVSDAVTLTGAVPRSEVYARLAAWHGFVMASNFEGFCNALVEAMAAGLPVAVSDIDTLREVGGETAIRFDHTDPEAIGQALVALAGRARTDGAAADRYDINRATSHHIDLYRDLLKKDRNAQDVVAGAE